MSHTQEIDGPDRATRRAMTERRALRAIVASDGGVFTYGDAGFFGSLGGAGPSSGVIGLFSTGAGTGYSLVEGNGTARAF
jgi:hypothetical protein